MSHLSSASRVNSVLLFGLLSIVMLVPRSVQAQKNSPDIPVVSNVVAIQGARIVQAPGRVIESGTIVFRDGVIESVGRRVDIPYDAQIIDGDSLTVYAGLIDVLSNVAVPAPASPTQRGPGQQQQATNRAFPTFERAGITPEKDVRPLLDPSDKSVEAHRNLGFTTVVTVPHGRMLPGTASIALLSGSDAAAMVVQGEQPVVFEYQGARGVYPGTPMAMMSKFRQLFREADRRMKVQAMYDDDPTGMTLPPYDAVHGTFGSIINRDKRVFAFTRDALEVHRTLSLQSELGFDLVLTGLSGGFDTVDKVAAADAGVALTLNVPDKPEWAAEVGKDSLDQILAAFDEETRTATFRDVEAERRNLEAKQLQSRARYVSMPAQYADAGVSFAFTSYGMEAKDVTSSVREYVGAGLSRDDMLAAFTTHAADLLGLSGFMGSLDEGKMANLVVTNGDLFAEKTKVRYVFVDGSKYEIASAKGGNGPNGRRGR